jgi:riboflavin kinase / FMN adenylyltransferase
MGTTENIISHFTCSNTVVTIGSFDGIHKGHQKIFAAVVKRATEIGGRAVAITFDPHPARVLMPERKLRLITSAADKEKIIFGTGINDIVNIDFSSEFAHTDAEEFVKEILVGLLNARWVIVGHNCRFGHNRKGNADFLKKMGGEYGFRVRVINFASLHGDVISSTRVRSAVSGGRVADAARMLGRAYHIDGTVIKGTGRGSALLNVPTANLETKNELIPKEGVYAVKVSLGGKVYDGAANIGRNPTFREAVMSYEIHILDFRRNLLGKSLRVHFLERIRDERRFASVEELGGQINKDLAMARRFAGKSRTTLYL